MRVNFNTMAELAAAARERRLPLHEVVIQREMETRSMTREAVLAAMRENWRVMQAAMERGIASEAPSVSGLTGGDAKRLFAWRGRGYLGTAALAAAARAVAVSEVNASMGRIVACPTAGSCGIVPAVLQAAVEKTGCTEDAVVAALFTAAGIGMVVEQNACIAGAAGGCQAECGTAAGMAAGALIELAGGTPEQICNGVALAIKNLLGLACDPVAGLVEVPCVKRNGFAAVHAMTAADMALAGVVSVIPVDEVISAMKEIGRAMPAALRETAQGGLAVTPTGKAAARRIFGKA